MRILHIASEMTPFAKVGGLADVVAALGKELGERGHEVKIVIPLYGNIKVREDWVALPDPLLVPFGDGPRFGRVWEARELSPGMTVYFLEHAGYYDRHEIYAGPWGSHGDNDERFIFLSKGGLALCHYLKWYPEVVHVHDWPTAFVPVLLNTEEKDTPLGRAASVLTIHNMEHQGYFPPSFMEKAGIPWSEFRMDSMESHGQVNLLKGGLFHATKLTTVSPHYSREILSAPEGFGLESVLRFRAGDLVGILNGVDTVSWDPSTDPLIPARYTAGNLEGKDQCKAALQRKLGLEVDPAVPVFGVVSRLASQKGLDLLVNILPWALREMHIQVAVLGSGDAHLESAFRHMQAAFPGKIGCHIGFDNSLAHLIEAGSDFFLMPSRFEPCGLNQMYSQRYGTLPIVRDTGGLHDTVEPYREGAKEDAIGTGFVFQEASENALYYTMGWACSTWYDRPGDIARMRQRAMHKDFSWEPSLRQYEAVYGWAIEARNPAPAGILS